MRTIKPFMSGNSQAIRVPKEFGLKNDEDFIIAKVGYSIIISPKEKAWEVFLEGINELPEDFLPDGRPPQGEQENREDF